MGPLTDQVGCPACGEWVDRVIACPDNISRCVPCSVVLARRIVKRAKSAPRKMAVPKGKRR